MTVISVWRQLSIVFHNQEDEQKKIVFFSSIQNNEKARFWEMKKIHYWNFGNFGIENALIDETISLIFFLLNLNFQK